MKLGDYAKSGKYLKWTETDTHNIALAISFDEYYNIEPVLSDAYGNEQYEVPVFDIIDKDTIIESVLATKSKKLLLMLLKIWDDNPDMIVRINKSGQGFRTEWNCEPTKKVYVIDSTTSLGKIKSLPAKK